MKHDCLALLLAVICLLTPGTSQAQAFATERLDKSPRHGEWVEVKHGARTVHSFVVYPEVKTKAGAVIVIHEIMGLTDWVRGMADQLAEAGYIAIAPDLLSGAAPGGGRTKDFPMGQGVREAISQLPPDQITADLNAVADYVAKLPASNGKVAVAGFCWGGGQTFRYATNNAKLQAALVFYGPPAAAADMARIACPVYGFYGENDARINATIDATKEQMKTAGKIYDPVVYAGAGHGFMRAGEDPAGTPANKKGREDSWVRIKEVLKKALQ